MTFQALCFPFIFEDSGRHIWLLSCDCVFPSYLRFAKQCDSSLLFCRKATLALSLSLKYFDRPPPWTGRISRNWGSIIIIWTIVTIIWNKKYHRNLLGVLELGLVWKILIGDRNRSLVQFGGMFWFFWGNTSKTWLIGGLYIYRSLVLWWSSWESTQQRRNWRQWLPRLIRWTITIGRNLICSHLFNNFLCLLDQILFLLLRAAECQKIYTEKTLK